MEEKEGDGLMYIRCAWVCLVIFSGTVNLTDRGSLQESDFANKNALIKMFCTLRWLKGDKTKTR